MKIPYQKSILYVLKKKSFFKNASGGININKNSLKGDYPEISSKYNIELDEIREQVKNGQCNTLKECLLLFEDLWNESHKYKTILSHKFQKEMEKISNKNPKQYEQVLKKIKEIRMNPNHYKPLSGDLHGAKRAHIGDFVLIYELTDKKIIFQDYGHHNHIYKTSLK